MTAMTGEIAGAMRERIGLLARGAIPDGAGGFADDWTMVATVWAAVAALPPGPMVEAERRAARARWRVTLRDRDDLAGVRRLIRRGRAHDVRERRRDPAQPGLVDFIVEETD